MKVLTASEMREVDRLTMERGIPGLVLMENAAHRVVEFLAAEFQPLSRQRIVILCGKGNNGGDGLAVARQLLVAGRPAALDVVLAAAPEEMTGDAAANLRMWEACGGACSREITPPMRLATLVIDALLGTGLKGPATGRYLDLIREINTGFPLATVVAVDIPSGLASDAPMFEGETVRAGFTVTFTAPKLGQVLWPGCERVGKLIVGPIGSAPELYEENDSILLSLSEARDFAALLAPRPPESNKGHYGHVLVIAGSVGKTGAAAMTGLSALRAGAGLVTVASAESAIPTIAGHAPELMTEPLDETDDGAISLLSPAALSNLVEKKTVLAVGPGVGTHRHTVETVRRAFAGVPLPVVVDADGLNALAGSDFRGGGFFRVLTPHPGEMARLTGATIAEVQRDRLGAARAFARGRNVCVVLKGNRTLIALPDGRAWVNPTGSPAMSTGGTGDILTGLIAGLIAQSADDPVAAVRAAVWLHGRAGELGARELGEQPLIATDLLRYLPQAIRECTSP